ncbi:ABC1 kinase family protein [Dyella jiangningensis]|uniref:Protein kinase domain-containing protein n=1 Tax=Dyella jiangningensis TaxID=1379159 RepID=A0A328P2F1_9GAMM|nr:AarF/UbiB family protein [Dyella jiangningensis]RAO76169.1 hypothetical protein CA260_10740 [Dyella jiangningensis]
MPGNLSRYAQILRFVLRYRRAGIFRQEDPEHASPMANRPEQFVADLERLGPAFIKLGQALSGRPDLVSASYLSALEKIQDDVDAVPVQAIRETIRNELGGEPEQIFFRFDDQPLAAGSLAQVHAVTLRDGTDAAVKVRRPGIEQRIRTDLQILERIARGFQRHTNMGRRYGAVQWIDELRRSLLNELDFLAEAAYMRQFAGQLAGYPRLYVPTVHEKYCSGGVLTMTRVHGDKLRFGSPLPVSEAVATEQAGQLLCAYIDQVFLHGLVHVDPHPGNLVQTEDGRLALLDFGMIASIAPITRRTLLKVLLFASEGDGDAVARLCERLFVELPEAELVGYRRAVGDAVLRYAITHGEATLEMGRLLLSLTTIGAQYGLRPPAELSLLGRAMLNLEPALRHLSPSLPTRELIAANLRRLLLEQLRPKGSPAEYGVVALDARRALLDAPEQLTRILQMLAENRMRFRIDGLEESHLIENLQKIANRIATGVIAAALFIAGAMLDRWGKGGHDTLSMLMYGAGAIMGAGLLFSSLRRDRSPRDDGG